MKISNVLKVSNIYKSKSITKSTQVNKSTKKDDLNISSTALDFQTALNAINKLDDVREDKVNDIKDRLKKGTYNISADAIADKMISN